MRAAAWAAALLLGGAVGVRVAGAFGLADTWVTAPVLGAFPWIVAAAALVSVVLALLTRRRDDTATRVAVLLVVVATTVGVGLLVPRAVGAPQPAADGPTVTVGVVNARIGGADADEVAALADAAALDLLAVVESTEDFAATLRGTSLAAGFPAVAPGPAGLVLSVGSLTPQREGFPAGDTPDVVWNPPGGGELRVTTVHASAPVGPTATATWAAGIARTPTPDDRPAVVLGDFNATLDHATFRALLADGWRDAADEVGAGLRMTYDGLLDDSPALPMAIDHVLVSPDIAVLDVDVLDVPGTDHRLLVARLQLPDQA